MVLKQPKVVYTERESERGTRLWFALFFIGAGSRGKGGAAAPLEIFWPPLDDFFPLSDLYPGPFWDKKTLLFRRRCFFC